MGVVTAQAAGVDEIVVCAPGSAPGDPRRRGAVRCRPGLPHGRRARVAALAYGTDSIARVDVIVGPGQPHVQEAKRLVSGDVGIDGFAGPSDVLIVAEGADAALVDRRPARSGRARRRDVVAVCVRRRRRCSTPLPRSSPRARDAAAGRSRCRASTTRVRRSPSPSPSRPSTSQLVGPGPEVLVDRRARTPAACSSDASSGTAFGDYVAGSNHTLPTGGAARFASGARTAAHFRRRVSEVRIG